MYAVHFLARHLRLAVAPFAAVARLAVVPFAVAAVVVA
jgi:hypothetical protein